MSDDTNYIQNNVDIGKCFVTRDYFNRVYTSVNTSYRRNALWTWGYLDNEISPTTIATIINDPFMVQPQNTYNFYPSGWKDFHISSSCINELNIRLLDQQGKMYIWGGLSGLGTAYVGASGVTGAYRPSAMCTTAIIETCATLNCIKRLGRDHSDCHLSYSTVSETFLWGCAAGYLLGTNCSLSVGSVSQLYQWPPTDVYAGFTGQVPYISIQNQVCSGIYPSHAEAGSLYFWGTNSVSGNRSFPVTTTGLCLKCVCSNGATVGGLVPDTNVLKIMGYNNKGQLGVSTTINCIGYSSVNCFSNTNPSLTVKSYSIGRCSSFAVASNGTLWAWGDNSAGQLGNNKTINTSCPVQSIDTNNDWKYVTTNRMGTAVAALKNDGSLWVWGDVCYVQQAGVGECIRRSSPVQVGTKKNWVKIAIETNRTDTQTSTVFMLGITEEDL
jgi:hypothetical protein